MCAGVAELSEVLDSRPGGVSDPSSNPSEIFCYYFYSSPTNKIIFIRRESCWIKCSLFIENINRKIYLDRKLRPIYNETGSSGHCLLYNLTGFQSFQETFFIKLDLPLCGHFYKTMEEAETAIK